MGVAGVLAGVLQGDRQVEAAGGQVGERVRRVQLDGRQQQLQLPLEVLVQPARGTADLGWGRHPFTDEPRRSANDAGDEQPLWQPLHLMLVGWSLSETPLELIISSFLAKSQEYWG